MKKHEDIYFRVSDPEIGRQLLSALGVGTPKVYFNIKGKPFVWVPKAVSIAEAEDTYARLWQQRSLTACKRHG